ncbi:MAG: RnfABCDGE type electron transport complex subunit D [Clostridiales bacterium]|nr:RnfABCDGE type electron transport complex subunit D [Clostridiales bacterium]MDY4769636.1 RnfABCDGE type electron transport complex subunit D [Lachnospiraceae bacterium]
MIDLLNVSASPHIRSKVSTDKIMLMVIISLLPSALFGCWNFGIRALLVLLISVASAVATEYIYEKCMHKTITVGDFSAVLTGLLLGMNMPPMIPLWMPALGSVFAILVVKQLFGGLGQNFMNPALAGRCFLMISFAGKMTDFTVPAGGMSNLYDTASGATPLAAMKAGEAVDFVSLFVGNIKGTIGETSAIALLIGAALLLFMKVIDWRIPGTYIGSFAVFIALFDIFNGGFDFYHLLCEICGGGLLLGAFFMATDYVTTPITKNGQLIYGCVLGLLTGIFRMLGASAEGVSYAIIFGNLLIPLIERWTIPTAFGKGGKKA